jgi:hypothetical protein
MWGFASQVSAQDAEPKFNSNADDLAKIRGVLEEYRQDIIRKDGYAITKLVLNHNVLFHHINTQERIDSARERNAQFDGIGPSHLDELVEIFATSKDKLEGKLQNIEIRQDGPLGWRHLITVFTSTTRLPIQASNIGRCAKLMAAEDRVRCLDKVCSQLTANSAPENKAGLCLSSRRGSRRRGGGRRRGN